MRLCFQCKRAVLSDPLPPEQLEVLKPNTTSDSVTVTWKYDKHKSHIEKWRVKYTVKGKSDVNHADTTSADVLHLTIGNLTAGQNYTFAVYGVTYNEVVSQDAPQVHATVGEYFIRKNTIKFTFSCSAVSSPYDCS